MRHKVMTIMDSNNNVILYNPTSIDWNLFTYPGGYYKHTISATEVIKPYLIAEAYYGEVEYEDVILLLNKIEYIWDVVPETEIKLPKKEDIDAFILANIK
jgi:hypothetical protein